MNTSSRCSVFTERRILSSGISFKEKKLHLEELSFCSFPACCSLFLFFLSSVSITRVTDYSLLLKFIGRWLWRRIHSKVKPLEASRRREDVEKKVSCCSREPRRPKWIVNGPRENWMHSGTQTIRLDSRRLRFFDPSLWKETKRQIFTRLCTWAQSFSFLCSFYVEPNSLQMGKEFSGSIIFVELMLKLIWIFNN